MDTRAPLPARQPPGRSTARAHTSVPSFLRGEGFPGDRPLGGGVSARFEEVAAWSEDPQNTANRPRPGSSGSCPACNVYSDSGRRHKLLKQGMCVNPSNGFIERKLIAKNEAGPNKWSSTRAIPRLVGVLAFTMTILAVLVGFVISVSCSSCYGHRSSQVGLPDRFAISDSMRFSPTRWTGLGLFMLSVIFAFLLGRFRYLQIRGICDEAFPALLRPNMISNIFGVLSCVLLATTVAFPPSANGSALALIRLSLLALGAISAILYLVIQYGWIERCLMRAKVIRGISHKLRLALFIIGGVLAIAALPLFLFRNELAAGGSDRAKLVSIFLLLFEFGSMAHVVASISLTDFVSMSINLTRLETLSKTSYVASTGVIPWFHSHDGVSRDSACTSS